MSQQNSDLDLAERAARGQQKAMAELVNRALPTVRGFARRIAGDAEEGDALAQEAFVTALERLGRYRGDASFATWVCAIALRKYADIQRKKRAERKMQQRIAATHQREPAALVAEEDTAERLWSLVAQLPKAHRETLIARATSESTRQAAARLGLTCNAMRVRLHRARLALRELILKHYPDWFGETGYGERRLPTL